MKALVGEASGEDDKELLFESGLSGEFQFFAEPRAHRA